MRPQSIPSTKKDILSAADYQERVKLDTATNVFVAVLQPSTSPKKSAAQNLISCTSGGSGTHILSRQANFTSSTPFQNLVVFEKKVEIQYKRNQD